MSFTESALEIGEKIFDHGTNISTRKLIESGVKKGFKFFKDDSWNKIFKDAFIGCFDSYIKEELKHKNGIGEGPVVTNIRKKILEEDHDFSKIKIIFLKHINFSFKEIYLIPQNKKEIAEEIFSTLNIKYNSQQKRLNHLSKSLYYFPTSLINILKKHKKDSDFSLLRLIEQEEGIRNIISYLEAINNILPSFIDESKENFDNVLSLLQEILENFKKPEIIIEKKKYPPIENYIERKVEIIEGDEKIIANLSQVVLKHKFVILLDDALYGKTIELQQVSYELCQKMPVSYFSLGRHYSGQTVEEILLLNYKGEGEVEFLLRNGFLLVIDGLDEISDAEKLFRNIQYIKDTYEDSHFLISCRKNFYNKELSAVTYSLIPLTNNQVNEYTEKNIIKNKHEFISKLTIKKISYLLHSPFYLKNLVKLYNQDILPETKAELFQKLIEDNLKVAISKYNKKSISKITNRNIKKITAQLTRLAIVMVLCNKNHIDDDEYGEIIKGKEIRDLLQHILIQNFIDGESVCWQFELLSFQEYLAAKYISTFSFEKIQTIITYKSSDIIQPIFINTLTLVVSIWMDKSSNKIQKLLDWLDETKQVNIIFQFESGALSSKERFVLFNNIYSKFKKNGTGINKSLYRLSDLARFVDNDHKLSNSLVNEILTINNRHLLDNCLEMLRFLLPISNNLKSSLKDRLIVLANTHEDNGVRRWMCIYLADLKLIQQKKDIDKIIEENGESNSQYVRAGLYYLITNSSFTDDYIDLLLFGIKKLHSMYGSGKYTNKEVTFTNERECLQDAFMSISKVENLNKVFSHFALNLEDMLDIMSSSDLKVLVKKGVEFHKAGNKKVFDSIEKLCLTIILSKRNEAILNDLFAFFIKTNTFSSFITNLIKTYNIESKEQNLFSLTIRTNVFIEILEEESCKIILNAYPNILKKEAINSLLFWLYKNNVPMYEFCYAILESKYKGIFLDLNFINRKNIEKSKEKRVSDLLCLESKENFANEVLEVINEYSHEDYLSSHEYWKIRDSYWAKSDKSTIAISFIKPKKIEGIKNDLINLDWKNYKVSILMKFHKTNEKVLSESHKDFIINWCKSEQKNIDFKYYIEYEPRKSFIYFIKRYNLIDSIEGEVLLNALYYYDSDNSFRIDLEDIEAKIDFYNIESWILEYLSQDLLPLTKRIIELMKYCKKKKVINSIPVAKKILKNNSEYYTNRAISYIDTDNFPRYITIHEAAYSIIHSIGDKEDIKELIKSKEVKLSTKWNLIIRQVLSENIKDKFCNNYLSQFISNREFEYWHTIIAHFIQINNLKALQLYTKHLEDTKDFSTNSYPAKQLFHIHKVEGLKYLMRLLQLSYNPDLKCRTYNDELRREVLPALRNIAKQSQSNNKKVLKKVKQFIKKNINIEGVEYLSDFISEIENSFFQKQKQGMKLKKVLKILNK